jgi:hypothetical protein
MGSLWNRSGTIERYADDLRAAGAKAYFFLGGTTTPLSVYQDAAEAAVFTHPVVADAAGRWPDIFIPFITSYDVRVTSADGVQLTYTLEVPNPNPVDVTTIVDPANTVVTGMIHAELLNTTKAGYVRLNGRTIGNAASTATERQHADTSALFAYLWNNLNNTIAPVSGGRGGTAVADFAANKTIVLPDMRGGGFSGLDDMGNVAAAAYAGLTFTAGSALIAGSLTGINGVTLAVENMPAHFHSGTSDADGGHTHTISGTATGTAAAETATHTHSLATVTVGNQTPTDHTHTIGTGTGTGGAAQLVGTSAFTAGGVGFNTVGATTINNTGVQSVNHTHALSGSTDVNSTTHTHNVSVNTWTGVTAVNGGTPTTGGNHTHAFSTDSKGGLAGVTQGFNNLGLTRLVTWFIKL